MPSLAGPCFLFSGLDVCRNMYLKYHFLFCTDVADVHLSPLSLGLIKYTLSTCIFDRYWIRPGLCKKTKVAIYQKFNPKRLKQIHSEKEEFTFDHLPSSHNPQTATSADIHMKGVVHVHDYKLMYMRWVFTCAKWSYFKRAFKVFKGTHYTGAALGAVAVKQLYFAITLIEL